MRKRIEDIITIVIICMATGLCICIYPLRIFPIEHGQYEMEATNYNQLNLTMNSIVCQELTTEFTYLESIGVYLIPQVSSSKGTIKCSLIDENGEVVKEDSIELSNVSMYNLYEFNFMCGLKEHKVYRLVFSMENADINTDIIVITNERDQFQNIIGNMYVNNDCYEQSLLIYLYYYTAPNTTMSANRYQSLILIPTVCIIVSIRLNKGRRKRATDTKNN